MKQVHMSLEITEVPADVEDRERVELIRLGGPRDGARIGYATVRYDEDALELGTKQYDKLKAALAPAQGAGLQVELGGEFPQISERPSLGVIDGGKNIG